MRAGDEDLRSAKRPSAEAREATGGPGTMTFRSAPTVHVATSAAKAAIAPPADGQSSDPADRPGSSSATGEGPVAGPSMAKPSTDRSTVVPAEGGPGKRLGNPPKIRAARRPAAGPRPGGGRASSPPLAA